MVQEYRAMSGSLPPPGAWDGEAAWATLTPSPEIRCPTLKQPGGVAHQDAEAPPKPSRSPWLTEAGGSRQASIASAPLRRGPGRRPTAQTLPTIAEEKRRRRLPVVDIPTPVPTPTPQVRLGEDAVRVPAKGPRAQDGLARAIASVEAELKTPLTFGEKVRAALHKMGADVGGWLRQCFGGRVR